MERDEEFKAVIKKRAMVSGSDFDCEAKGWPEWNMLKLSPSLVTLTWKMTATVGVSVKHVSLI
jgi:hypothetical protein